MSETKQAPLQFVVVRQGEAIGEYLVIASPVPTPFQTPREVTMARESQRQYIQNAVNARPKVEELVWQSKNIIASFRACMKHTGSSEEAISIRLNEAEKAIREVEAALGGKADV